MNGNSPSWRPLLVWLPWGALAIVLTVAALGARNPFVLAGLAVLFVIWAVANEELFSILPRRGGVSLLQRLRCYLPWCLSLFLTALAVARMGSFYLLSVVLMLAVISVAGYQELFPRQTDARSFRWRLADLAAGWSGLAVAVIAFGWEGLLAYLAIDLALLPARWIVGRLQDRLRARPPSAWWLAWWSPWLRLAILGALAGFSSQLGLAGETYWTWLPAFLAGFAASFLILCAQARLAARQGVPAVPPSASESQSAAEPEIVPPLPRAGRGS